MSFEWLISRRYLRAKRRQSFISLITLISVAGVALGVCALIVVLSVMSGFQREWRDRILGVTAHVVIMSYEGQIRDYDKLLEKLRKLTDVKAASPFIYTQAMVAAGGRISGTVVRGIDPRNAPEVTAIKKSLLSGDLDRLNKVPEAVKGLASQPGPPIVLGKELAQNLGVQVGYGVRLISPFGEETPLGRRPKATDFVVSDLFRSGMYEYDANLSFLSLAEAQNFLGLGRTVTGIEIKVKDIYQAGDIARHLGRMLGYPFYARDWMTMNRNLFAALKLEKTVMFIILTLIILVAAFNIISTLIMIVMEKTKDIAILKAIGATSSSIMKIFVYQGLIVGLVGTGLGLSLGLFLCEILRRYQFIHLPADVYYITTLPVQVSWLDLGLISLAATAVSFLATIYPSRKAAKLDPVEALRYE